MKVIIEIKFSRTLLCNLHYFNTFVAVCNLNLVQEVRIYCSSDGWPKHDKTLVLQSLSSTVFISSATLTTTI